MVELASLLFLPLVSWLHFLVILYSVVLAVATFSLKYGYILLLIAAFFDDLLWNCSVMALLLLCFVALWLQMYLILYLLQLQYP